MNFKDIILDHQTPIQISAALNFLCKNEYTTIGDFLIQLPDEDLSFLMDCVHAVQLGDLGDKLKWACCLSDALALAEGLPVDEPEIYRLQHMMVVLTFENLCRSGVVNFDRTKATLCKTADFEKMASLKK